MYPVYLIDAVEVTFYNTSDEMISTGITDMSLFVKHNNNNVVGDEKRDHVATKYDFLLFFKPSPFQGHMSPRLSTQFVDSLGFLLHRSN